MKFFQLALLCFICTTKSYGQTGGISYGGVDVEITKEKKPKKIYTNVEITSAFPGGDSSFIQSLEKELNQSIPYKNGAKAGKHIVSVKFIIDRDGTLSDIRCLKDPGFGMYEPVRVAILKNFRKGLRWTPSNRGSKVGQYRTSAIRFQRLP